MAIKLQQYAVACLALLSRFALSAPDGRHARDTTASSNSGDSDVYDYIVVGSGPGGAPVASNLAKAGYSVLLLEAGDDQSADVATNILALGSVGGPPVAARWDFYVRQYADDAQQLKNSHLTWKRGDGSLWVGNGSAAPADATLLGVYYPRGATLGGSSVVNAGVTLLPSRSDWNTIGSITGDNSWNPDKFRQIFQQVEKNHYLPTGTPGHGFNGFLDTNSNDGTVWSDNPTLLETFKSMVSTIGGNPADAQSDATRDINNVSPTRDQTQGLFDLPFHANQTWGRFSARNIVLDTLNAKKANGAPKYPLTLKVHSLVTRVLFDKKAGRKPKATGVEYLEGQSLYSADPRYNPATNGTLRRARARREVILAAGVFNTPQILQLSGIGPRQDLAQLNIPLVVDLPGVGNHMQDNQEFPVVGLANEPFVTLPRPGDPVCTFGFPPDPCIDAWRLGQGPYARAAPNTHAFLLKTNHSTNDDVDVLLFGLGNFAFRGYWPSDAFVNIPADPPGTFGLSMVKMNPNGRAGTVKLRSTNPRDTPDINFNVFSEGAAIDLGAMADAVAWARRVFGGVAAPLGPIRPTEPPCSAATPADCVATDQQYIKDQAFGHHATGTCAIGADSDPTAVLDSKFRVRGVTGLRVVDGSAFPRSPGAFPVISTFLISEKASGDILDDA